MDKLEIKRIPAVIGGNNRFFLQAILPNGERAELYRLYYQGVWVGVEFSIHAKDGYQDYRIAFHPDPLPQVTEKLFRICAKQYLAGGTVTGKEESRNV